MSVNQKARAWSPRPPGPASPPPPAAFKRGDWVKAGKSPAPGLMTGAEAPSPGFCSVVVGGQRRSYPGSARLFSAVAAVVAAAACSAGSWCASASPRFRAPGSFCSASSWVSCRALLLSP